MKVSTFQITLDQINGVGQGDDEEQERKIGSNDRERHSGDRHVPENRDDRQQTGYQWHNDITNFPVDDQQAETEEHGGGDAKDLQIVRDALHDIGVHQGHARQPQALRKLPLPLRPHRAQAVDQLLPPGLSGGCPGGARLRHPQIDKHIRAAAVVGNQRTGG